MDQQAILSKLKAAQRLLDEVMNLLQVEVQVQSPPPPQAISPSGLLAWGSKLSPAAKKFLVQTAQDFKIGSVNWLPACIAFETVETFSPSIKNPHSSGTGLIQFMRATCQGMTEYYHRPFDHNLLTSMSVEEQLPWVWYYFRMIMEQRGIKELKTLTDVYMIIHWPNAVGLPENVTMYAKGTQAYDVNKVLDSNGDHVITKAEAGALVAAKLAKGLLPERIG